MKQSKIIEAYNAAMTLSECPISEVEQWSIYKLRKALRPHFDFQLEREDALREKYQDYIDEEGRITGVEAQKFFKDMKEIGNLDIELEKIDKPKIMLTHGITCKIIEQLEDFVEFVLPTE